MNKSNCYEESYWKNEYEQLRRKKKKEMSKLKLQQSLMCHKTLDLLKGLGLSDKEIQMYFRSINDRTN